MATYDNPTVQVLTGSSLPSGETPVFEPVAAGVTGGCIASPEEIEAQREKDGNESVMRQHARMVFEPWEGECPFPSNEEWNGLANPYLVTTRIAWATLIKTKPEAVAMVTAAVEDGMFSMALIS